MSENKITSQEVANTVAGEDHGQEEVGEANVNQKEQPNRQEEEATKGDEDREINESVDRVLDWIKQGVDIQQRILDLTKQSFDGNLSGDEATNIIRQFESIPADIAKVAAEFDTAIVALMEQRRGVDSDLTWALRNAAKLRGELEERMAGIEQSTEKDDFERLTTMLKDGSTKSGEGFVDWSEWSLKEIKGKCDELNKMQKEGQKKDSSKTEELQQEIDDWKGSVEQTFRRFVADSRLHFLRFRTNNYRLLNLRLSSLMKGETKALEVLKFKKQDKELLRFMDEFTEKMSKYESELSGRLKELGEQKKDE